MSYLAPHFDPDVFVSYSHGAPSGGQAPLRDWSRDLVEKLKAGLHALRTEFDSLEVWMDPAIDPTARLTEELKGKANACGVLMIIMSERYLKSRWCHDELEWFKEQIEGRAGSDGRVFVIKAQDTVPSHWPEFLRDDRGHAMPGFSFYDPFTGEPRGFQLREPNDEEYFKELGRVRLWLTRRLRELRDHAAKEALVRTAATVPPPTGQVGQRRVYVHAPPDTEALRAEIDTALLDDGIVPVSLVVGVGKGLADWQREAKALRVETAKRCEVLTLLRVADSGRFIADVLDIGVDERERISAERGARMPCAVFDKTGEALPLDVKRYAIEHFDVRRTDWRGQFRTWLDASRGAAA